MTKRIARPDRRPPKPEALVHVTGRGICGRLDAADEDVAQVIALVDGVPQGVALVGPMADGARGFELPLPPHVLGSWLDLVDAESGASLLEREIELAALRGLRWGGWVLEGRRVSGSFRFDGPAAPEGGTALPVEFRAGAARYGACWAVPAADGTYRFAAELGGIPEAPETVEITPRVGGLALQPRLRVSPAAFGYAGAVDPATTLRAEGWVVDLASPRKRVMVELRINGRRVATARADRARAGTTKIGLSDGQSGFVIPFPPTVPLDRDLRIEVVVAGTGLNLANSPYVKPASPPYLGHFDALEGPFAGGWVVDMHDPSRPVRVDAICDGEVIGSGVATLYRGDVESAGLPTARCGFRFLIERPLADVMGRDIFVHIAGSDQALAGSPRQLSQNHNITRFLARASAIPPKTMHRLARHLTYRTRAIGISIIMPVFDPPRKWLVEALASVQGQWGGTWELICIDDGSREPYVREVLDGFAARDPRIRVLHAAGNVGIAGAVNFGLRAARGNWVTFLDHDDALEPDAVAKLAGAALETGADLIYSDEVLTTSNINSVIEVRARPAFSHDYYLSHPYFVHMVCVRTQLARDVAGWDESLAISADVDFVLRVLERAERVAHVPSVLYRWRTHEGSVGHARKSQATKATRAALARHLARLGRGARVAEGANYNEYRIDWPDDGGDVLVVIPTKDRAELLEACIASIERTAPDENLRIVVIDHQSSEPGTLRLLEKLAARHTVLPYAGPFNYARMNNLAVRTQAKGARYVLFVNNDVEAREPGWIARLRSLAGRPEVGAVGPLLLYGDGRAQHAGVLIGFNDAAEHAMKFARVFAERGERYPGYNCNLTSVRDYSAVTAACMMMRTELFAEMGGFDESFAVGFNDTDLCLRLGEAGYRILYDGYTVLDHHESATRTETNTVHHPEDDRRLRARWSHYFEVGDPFYNPMLAPRGSDHALRSDEACKGRAQARVVSRKGGWL